MSNQKQIPLLIVTLMLFLGLVLILPSTIVKAQESIFFVNSTNDANDGACNAIHCSLREAIEAANTNPGKDTIAFNIPGAGPHTIQPITVLPTITDSVTIDGYTQPGASPNTNPIDQGLNTILKIEIDGSKLSGASAYTRVGLYITAGNSVVRGLVINRCSYGIAITTNSNNIIEGNFLGTNVAGTTALGNFWGVSIDGFATENNTIGGTTASASNLISGNTRNGVNIGHISKGHVIQGNLIGTNITGSAKLGNGNYGVRIDAADNNSILDNIIAYNTYSNIAFFTSSDNNTIARNIIKLNDNQDGITVDGSDTHIISNYIAEAKRHGILIYGGANHVIMSNVIALNTDSGIWGTISSSSIQSNTIFSNGDNGITVLSGTDNAVTDNSIYNNGGLGIDLNNDGVTPNDFQDVDTGSNNLQNFPILTSNPVIHNTIEGTLNSSPNTEFRLEFFTSDTCDPSGNGEGKTFIGSTTVTTDNNGAINFSHILTGATLVNLFVTATATDPNGNTSEFSNCVPTPKPIVIVDDNAITDEDISLAIPVLSNDSDPNGQTLMVVSVASSGHGNATSNGTTVTYTPTLNFYGADYITYKVANTYGVTDTATVTITVRPINDPPVFTSTPVTSIGVDETYIYDVTVTDVDVSDTLTITTLSIPAWISFTVESTATGTLTGNPTRNEIGDYVVQLQVSDGILTDTQIFSIAVRPIVQFSSDEFDVEEEKSTAPITVTLTTPSLLTVSVKYTTNDGTALVGDDYITSSGTLTFTPDITTQVFNVTIMDDMQPETIETITLELENPVNAILGSPDFAVLNIINNDLSVRKIYIPIILK